MDSHIYTKAYQHLPLLMILILARNIYMYPLYDLVCYTNPLMYVMFHLNFHKYISLLVSYTTPYLIHIHDYYAVPINIVL